MKSIAWSEKDIDILKNNYHLVGWQGVQPLLEVRRTAQGIKIKAERLGLKYRKSATYIEKTCENCGKTFKVLSYYDKYRPQKICSECKEEKLNIYKKAKEFAKSNQHLSREEVINKLVSNYQVRRTYAIQITKEFYKIKERLSNEDRAKVIAYIKLHHRQTYTWLHEHIKRKLKILVNADTIKTWKIRYNCLTDRKKIREDWVKYIRLHWKKQTDKELAVNLKNKFKRDISPYTVAHIRAEHRWYRPIKKGYTVREIRKCLNCGTDIKITHKNKNQKFCCTRCAYTYRAKQNNKRNMSVVTSDKVSIFLRDWTRFAKKVIYDRGYGLNSLEKDEVFTDFIGQIPSLIYFLETKKITRSQHQRNYIATSIKNLINKKLSRKIEWDKNTYSIERQLEMNKV